MTISSQTRKAGPFVGSGSTGPFAFAFKIFQPSDMLVVKVNNTTSVETTLVLTTDFTVSLNFDQNSNPGGNVTLVAPLASGYNMVMSSQIPYLQETDLTNQGGFYPEVITSSLDNLTIQTQQLKEEVDRSAKLPITSAEDADALVADIVRLADSAANIDIVANNITSVNTDATYIANINTVAGAITNVNAVGTNIANVNTNATNIANINTVAAANTNVNLVGNNIASVNTTATNIASINTNTTNIVAIQNASANATTATTQAGIATTQATNAAASAVSAAASYDAFDDRYLGSKATAPTLDNDGAALLVGALYWDTVIPGMRAYTGTAWTTLPAATAGAIANTPSGNIVATDVQAAINELDAEKANLTTNTFTGTQTLSGAAVFQYGSATSVIQTDGTDYQSQGTVIIPHDHVRFIHTYRPLGTAQGGTATFSTDGANTFVGDRSGNFTMTPDATAVGNPDIHCSYNAGFGTQALGQITTGYNNAACGVNAGRYNTQGFSNAFFGRDAAELTTTGNYNVAVGQSALHENTTGIGNIAVGGKAGYDSITGDYNTYIGFTASGTGITSGSNNTIIGSRISALGDVSKNIVLASGDGVIRQHTNASGNTSYGSSFAPIATGHFRGSATTNGTAKRVIVVDDDSAIAAGIGGGMSFRFIYTGTTYSEAVNIKASKDNATAGNYAGSMVFSTQAHGASPAEAGRFTSTKDFLLTAGTGGIGYGTGSGGTVTQATSRTTGVTLNKPTGQITMFSAAGSVVAATFTVTNTVIAATDTVVLSQKSGTNLYVLLVTAVAAGSFNITFYTTGGVATDAPVINYTIIRGVTS